MVGKLGTAAAADSRLRRYRQAEGALWASVGLEPTERFIDLDFPRVRLRVVEVGSGDPVLLVGGSGGTGPYWGPLVAELPALRCIMVDRPGWGLSSRLDYSKYEYRTVAAELMSGVLDKLGLDRAHMFGASIGNVWALALAVARPSRVGRIVLLGGGPLVQEIRMPTFIRLLASPIGAIIVRIPQKPGRLRSILRGLGHGASLDAGRMDDYISWRVAFERNTDAMRSERDMVRSLVSGKGWRPGLTFEDRELAAIEQPTLMVYGTADPVGTVDIWKRVAGLPAKADLNLVEGAGHMPWFDEPSQVGEQVRGFLRD